MIFSFLRIIAMRLADCILVARSHTDCESLYIATLLYVIPSSPLLTLSTTEFISPYYSTHFSYYSPHAGTAQSLPPAHE